MVPEAHEDFGECVNPDDVTGFELPAVEALV
jgi:hypothetical protein